MTKLNFYELGTRNPIEDYDEIVWFLEHLAKSRYKSRPVAFWVSIKQTYHNRLMEMQAYELVAYIQSKVSTSQEKRLIKARIKAKEKAAIEHDNFMKEFKHRKTMCELLKNISCN